MLQSSVFEGDEDSIAKCEMELLHEFTFFELIVLAPRQEP